MVNQSYIPDRGHIVKLNFNPTQGHEQKGLRPAFVISPYEYNVKNSLALFMPITAQVKGYPFEVSLPSELTTYGVILVDHIKSLDYKVRLIQFIEIVPEDVIQEVQAKIEVLIF
ncbi:type II toxin-antitoxin system PemK/MazF family toxin [Planktothrix pseudagardhii]|uniref:Endoribonuclease MazF n=1 Tax=Planktothrix pseudagardhii TaxID=132604 RepID=A0A9W4CLB4_9CYAN|nr:type II toxin-antitoxin system PemK/MazF family toxin [Planktothrix pseudagardhii]CAD5953562.1 Endoribonuclease MazF [Planktothrix pseudagardhii]